MDKDLKEIKEKLNKFVNKYNIADIDLFISENLDGYKIVTLKIEV